MLPFVIRLKNYRCFADTNPTELEIGPGMTALVGPNNSGKSSFIRMFYELRNVLATLQPSALANYTTSGMRVSLNYNGVEDPAELLNFQTARQLLIEIRLPGAGPTSSCSTPKAVDTLPVISSRSARAPRQRGRSWRASPARCI
jgi:AAA ATPase domain